MSGSQIESLVTLRRAQRILRQLDAHVDRQREDARIILARAIWHLDNRVAALYAEAR